MSITDDLPDMDGADLLGLLVHGEEQGYVDPLFPVESDLIESWLSEQDVRLHTPHNKYELFEFHYLIFSHYIILNFRLIKTVVLFLKMI